MSHSHTRIFKGLTFRSVSSLPTDAQDGDIVLYNNVLTEYSGVWVSMTPQTSTNLIGLIDGSRLGGGIFLTRPDGTVRELTIDNNDNIVIKDV